MRYELPHEARRRASLIGSMRPPALPARPTPPNRATTGRLPPTVRVPILPACSLSAKLKPPQSVPPSIMVASSRPPWSCVACSRALRTTRRRGRVPEPSPHGSRCPSPGANGRQLAAGVGGQIRHPRHLPAWTPATPAPDGPAGVSHESARPGKRPGRRPGGSSTSSCLTGIRPSRRRPSASS